MSKSEFIVWCAESREQIRNDHMDWSLHQVDNYLKKIAIRIADRNPDFFGEQNSEIEEWRKAV